ncbi:MAG: LolE [Chloroflexi bacterium]|nr:LolE [Chloroflexota bacterium]
MIALFAIRNAFRRKTIALLAIIGVGVGCALMTSLLGLSGEAQARLDNTLTQVAGNMTITERNSGGGAFVPSFGLLPAAFANRIASLPHARYAEGMVTDYLPPYVDLGRGASPGILIGVDTAKDKLFGGPESHVSRGRPFLKPGEVIAGADFDALGRSSLLGYGFNVLGREGGSPVHLRIVGIFQTGDPQADSELFTDLGTVRSLLTMPADQVNVIAVHADTVRNAVVLADEIRRTFQHSQPAIDVLLARDAVKQLDNTLGTVQLFLLAISLIAAIGGGMSIAVSMIMSVMERRTEFGVLKAVGWSNFNITSSVLVESTLIGCVGAACGLVLGTIALGLLTTYVAREQVIWLAPSTILAIFGFGVLVGAIAGLYPALRAAAVRPIETLQGM